MTHYTLIRSVGESLGAMELAGQDWQPGMTISRGPSGDELLVLDVLDSDDPEAFAILVVEKA